MTTARWELALGGGKRPSDDQRAAITAPLEGRRCIDAGAGTGKTATLALRALYLIETGQLLARELLVVTFTRKAAAEIGQRIHNMLPPSGDADAGGSVTCSTIHALAASLLREFAYDCGLADLPRTVTDG
ncbi:MAG: UvrD-helicase domain-containing protein, partial [Vulcanimicrobiaceae bacterium]